MRESSVEKAIVKHAEAAGLLAFKFTSPGKRGVPDRLFIHESGRVLFLEVKAPGQKPNEGQLRMIERLKSFKVSATWVDNAAAGKIVINKFVNRDLTK